MPCIIRVLKFTFSVSPGLIRVYTAAGWIHVKTDETHPTGFHRGLGRNVVAVYGRVFFIKGISLRVVGTQNDGPSDTGSTCVDVLDHFVVGERPVDGLSFLRSKQCIKATGGELYSVVEKVEATREDCSAIIVYHPTKLWKERLDSPTRYFVTYAKPLPAAGDRRFPVGTVLASSPIGDEERMVTKEISAKMYTAFQNVGRESRSSWRVSDKVSASLIHKAVSRDTSDVAERIRRACIAPGGDIVGRVVSPPGDGPSDST